MTGKTNPRSNRTSAAINSPLWEFFSVEFGIMPVMRLGFSRILLGCVVLPLSGCSWMPFFGDEPPADAITIVTRLQEATTTQGENAPKGVELPVRVNYSFKSKPAVNTELEVEIEYLALKPLHELKMGYTTSDGLELVDNASPLSFTALKQFDVITQRVVVMPKEENHYTFSIYVVTKEGEEERGKQITVPIAVGRYSLQSP